jgi:hypothetical protein
MNSYSITVCKAEEDNVLFMGKISAEDNEEAKAYGESFVGGLANFDTYYDVRLTDRWGNEIGNWSV